MRVPDSNGQGIILPLLEELAMQIRFNLSFPKLVERVSAFPVGLSTSFGE